jgi:hypothetical protein
MSDINTSSDQHVKSTTQAESNTCADPMSQNVPQCPTPQNDPPPPDVPHERTPHALILTDPPIHLLANAPTIAEAKRNLLDRTLTPIQLQAISLLITGLSDSAVAKKLSINRKTINRWRLFDPLFASRLNRMRKAIWANTIDRLRSLLPKSVAILAKALASDNTSHQLRAAIQLLKIAGASRLAPRTGPDNANDILVERCQQHRRLEHDPVVLRKLGPPNEDDLYELHRHLLEHIAHEDQLDNT